MIGLNYIHLQCFTYNLHNPKILEQNFSSTKESHWQFNVEMLQVF
jgi:hypothetical protein